MKYRTKPVVIDAVQWTGENYTSIRDLCGAARPTYRCGNKLMIDTLEGIMTAALGDWVIKGVRGEPYPCKPDIFEMTYESAEVPTQPEVAQA